MDNVTPILMLVFLLASFVQASAGFGFALVAVGALALLTPLTDATPMIALLNAPVTFYMLWKLRKHLSWAHALPLLIGVAVGTPIGVYALVHWPKEILLRILAVVLLAAAYHAARPGKPRETGDADGPARRDGIIGLLAGGAAGALGGAFGTSGPPVIAYVYCRPWTKELRTATLQSLFAMNLVIAASMFAAKGLYTPELLTRIGLCAPGVVLGMLIGYALFRRIPARGLEVFVAAFLAVIAVRLLVWS